MKLSFCIATFIALFSVVKASVPEICKLPSKFGLCKALIPRYFFNINLNKCEHFTYGGCGGNANNFQSEDECNSACNINL
uniref:BPTI/Kunitz inhibitor domain-containing protein n=1 Tax=Megaselia scalaris TaxID=36166 RepID=T1H1P6_MEGSC